MDKKHGNGVYRITKGDYKGYRYEGKWENDLMHGSGIEYIEKERFEGT